MNFENDILKEEVKDGVDNSIENLFLQQIPSERVKRQLKTQKELLSEFNSVGKCLSPTKAQVNLLRLKMLGRQEDS
jgi:hypothetical protein